MAIDLQTVVTPEEYKKMERLVEINTTMKNFESEKKTLTDEVKDIMSRLNIDNGSVGAASFTLVHSTRKQLPKAVHDKFVAELVGLNKQNLIVTSIEPNLDAVMDEVDAGTLDRSLVEKYVSISDVRTLRCNL